MWNGNSEYYNTGPWNAVRDTVGRGYGNDSYEGQTYAENIGARFADKYGFTGGGTNIPYDNFSGINAGQVEGASSGAFSQTTPNPAPNPVDEAYPGESSPLQTASADGTPQGFFGRLFAGTPLGKLFGSGAGADYKPSKTVQEAIDQQTKVEAKTELQNKQAEIKTVGDLYNRTAAAFGDYIGRFIWILVGTVVVGAALLMFIFSKEDVQKIGKAVALRKIPV
jgi:hypothetical protein